MTTLFVLRERRPGETRVAAVPETVKRYVKAGLTVRVEEGAGSGARISDSEYAAEGAEIVPADGVPAALGAADVVVKVQPPTVEECQGLGAETLLVSYGWPALNHDVVRAAKDRGFAWLAMDLVPRISRAQSMDALSSQATVAGYKAVLLAASHLPKLCPLLMTAAGTVPPAKVVIFGAGVAGLQAIATARRLGCIVEATDVRIAVKEQVESLGASFIDVPGMEDMEDERGYAKEATPEFLAKQREEVAKRVAEADIVITTAQIPGRQAPSLVSQEMVESMKPGSVIVDMAVESGGNCVLSKEGETVVHNGVSIVGPVNIPASLPDDASDLYSKNILALIKPFIGDEGAIELNLEDEVVAGCLLTHDGKIHHQRTAEAFGQEVTA